MKNILFSVFFLLAVAGNAQFSADSPVVISEEIAGAAYDIPHIATADSGFYVTWYNETSGYKMYIQYIDPLGNPKWDEPALVTDYPQDSWVSNYSLVSDGTNAYVVFSDTRNGNTDKDIFGYKFNPAGESVWGAAGVELVVADADYDAELGPKAVVLGNGDLVAAWSKMSAAGYTADMQWLAPNGDRRWDNGNSISDGDKRILEPHLVSAGDSLVYVVYFNQDGQYGDREIHVQLIDKTGQNVWDSPVVATNNSGVGMGRAFGVMPAKNNGLYITWYGDPDFNSNNDVFAQHVTIDGSIGFVENGLNLSVNDQMNQTTVSCVGENNDGHPVFMWSEVNGTQSESAVKLQVVGADGTLLLGDQGTTISENHTLKGKGQMQFGQVFFPAQTAQGQPLEMLAYQLDNQTLDTVSMGMNFEEMSSFSNGQFIITDVYANGDISEVRIQNLTHRAEVGAEAVLQETALESFASLGEYRPDSVFYYLEMDRASWEEMIRPMNIYQTLTYLDEPADELGNYRVKVEAANGNFRFYQLGIVQYALADILETESEMYFVHTDSENKVLYVEMQVVKPDSDVDLVLSPGARLRIDTNWDYDYSTLNHKIDSLLNIELKADTSYMAFEIVDYLGDPTDWTLAFVLGSGAIADGAFEATIYPNPASDYLIVESKIKISEIQIISMDGRIQKTCEIHSRKANIPVSGLMKGVYLLKVQGEGNTAYSTFIKQ
ncbi:MAG: T9SS type A sorting domain-containing protein [Salinivirgaceae bacterium]